MIPISKQIINKKRAAQRVARFCVYRVHGFYVFSIGFFISYLRQDKKVDNVKLNSTYLHSPIFAIVNDIK